MFTFLKDVFTCVCLSANRITQKLLTKSLWKFMEWLDIIQGQIDFISNDAVK